MEKNKNNQGFSVIVPCFNENNSLPKAIYDLILLIGDKEDWELIVVDDGSSDGSTEKLRQLQADIPRMHLRSHQVNRGYGASLKTGIQGAKFNKIVITDADGTYPNERIPELAGLVGEFDMVIGARTSDNVTYSKIRAIPKVFLTAYASWIAGQKIPDINSGLRAFRKDLIEKFIPLLSNKFSFTITSTLAFLTNDCNVHYEPIDYFARTGKSKIKPVKDTLRFVQLITRMGMYFAPLRVLSPFILVLTLAFLLSAAYDVIWLNDITDKTLMLLLSTMNTTFFALLADMIEKRSVN